jgi:hypothetical protein
MSESVGLNYRSRIPTFGDDASIEEAFKVYHYGVDDWTSQPIPDNSIEGNFRTLNTNVTSINATIAALGTTYVARTSSSSSPNVIIPANTTTVPLTLRGASGQTEPLQRWQNSSSTNLAIVFPNGAISSNSYLNIGSTTQSTTTAANVVIGNAAHKGIAIRAASGQTDNLQEWQNSSGTAISWVSSNGTIFSNGEEVGSGDTIGSFFLMGG